MQHTFVVLDVQRECSHWKLLQEVARQVDQGQVMHVCERVRSQLYNFIVVEMNLQEK